MAITYPINHPSTPDFASVDPVMGSRVASVQSPFTAQKQNQVHQGQYWRMEVKLPPIKKGADSDAWLSFFAKLNGKEGTFYLGLDPLKATPRGTPSGTPVVDGANQTGQTLDTRGWTASATGVLLEGDYIQVGDYLYMVMTDVDSDSSGDATLDIWPRLRTSPADGSSITTSNAKGLFQLASNERPWREIPPDFYEISFTAEEAI